MYYKAKTSYYKVNLTFLFPCLASTSLILQGKLNDGISDIARFTLNSTLGIGGFIDVASGLGLDKNDEDFGQTLAVWGVSDGPYLVLPGLGPSTMRDTLAMIPDAFLIGRKSFQGCFVGQPIIPKPFCLTKILISPAVVTDELLLKRCFASCVFIPEAFLIGRNPLHGELCRTTNLSRVVLLDQNFDPPPL